MFTTAIHSCPLSFTPVNNYAVHDEEGLHFGNTLRRFLAHNRIMVTEFAPEIGLSRGGLNNILINRHIGTDRLTKICRASGHNFFQYYADLFSDGDDGGAMQMREPKMEYHEPVRSRIVLDIEDGQVVGTSNDKDAESVKELLEQQQKQWDALMAIVPELAKKMAKDPGLNPTNMDESESD